MIETLSVSNFRAIRESGDLALKPGLNVLIGPNGAGKSSLVEALRFLHEAVVTDPTKALARWRGWSSLRHRRAGADEPVTLRLSLRELQKRTAADYMLRLLAADNGIDVRIQAESLARKVSEGPGKKRELLEASFGKGSVRDEVSKDWVPFELTERDLAIRYQADRARHRQIIPFTSDIMSWRFVNPVPALMRPPTSLSVDPTWQETGIAVALQLARASLAELAEVSRRLAALVEGAEELSARLSPEGALLEIRELVHQGVFPSWTLSDGTLRVLAILTALHIGAPPALLCVEEPENSLHPSVIDSLIAEFQAAGERGTQVIVTTHSPYLLNRVGLDNVGAYWVDRPDGATRFIALPADERMRQEMERFGLGELLAQGALARSA